MVWCNDSHLFVTLTPLRIRRGVLAPLSKNIRMCTYRQDFIHNYKELIHPKSKHPHPLKEVMETRMNLEVASY